MLTLSLSYTIFSRYSDSLEIVFNGVSIALITLSNNTDTVKNNCEIKSNKLASSKA
jgi:hypothetical protein